MSRSRAIWLHIAAGILFLMPMILYGPHDREEWPNSVWSTLQYATALWEGRMPPMWSDDLGLGTPMPIGFRMDLAPPFLLYPWLSIRWILPLFYALYLGVALIYLWRLCADLQLRTPLRLLIGLSFLCLAPTVEYIYSDDWPSVFHCWCLFPVIFFYLRRLCFSSERRESLNLMLMLGLVGGLWALNSHTGVLVVYSSILLVYVIVAAMNRKDLLLRLSGSILIAGLISSEHMYYLVSETMKFPDGLVNFRGQDGISFTAFLKTLLRPLDTLLIPLLTNPSEFVEAGWLSKLWSSYKADYAMRIPFMGTLFLVAALLWSINRIQKGRSQSDGIPDQRALAITVLFSFAVMFMPNSWLFNIPSGAWMYRDGLVLFGLLAAGRWFQDRRNGHSRLTPWIPLLLFLQAIQMMTGSYPALHNAMTTRGMQYYENFGQEVGLPGWILQHADNKASRIFATVPFTVGYDFVEDGLYSLTDLTFFGLKPFNADIKSVSMDTLGQSHVFGHGQIQGHYDILSNKSMLDVFGINLVMALDSELGDNLKQLHEHQSKFMLEIFGIHIRSKPVNNLVLLGEHQGRFEDSSHKILLYRNDSAWPQAFLMNPEVTDLEERRVCSYNGAICRDFSEWQDYRLKGEVTMEGKDGRYIIRISPSDKERLFVTSKLYRPEWVALDDRGLPLSTEQVGGTLLGVRVPPGLRTFILEFRPLIRRILWIVSIVSLILAALTLCLRFGHRLLMSRVREEKD